MNTFFGLLLFLNPRSMDILKVRSLVSCSSEMHPLLGFDDLSLSITSSTDLCPEFQHMLLLPEKYLDSTLNLKYWVHLPPTLTSLPFIYKVPISTHGICYFPRHQYLNIWSDSVPISHSVPPLLSNPSSNSSFKMPLPFYFFYHNPA